MPFHRLRRPLKRSLHYSRAFVNGLNIPLSINDIRINRLRDAHLGERAFILGMGPSLKAEDIFMLENEITFACNKVYLLADPDEWRPTYYSVTDIYVAENNREIIQQLPYRKIFNKAVREYFKDDSTAVFINELKYNNPGRRGPFRFSRNPLVGVEGGWTVLYFQMQLAYFMGIREIILLGVDFSFKVPEGQRETWRLGEVIISQGEVNHCHPDYRKPGEKWTMPQLDVQEKAFMAARHAFEEAGGRVINASRETKLNVFERDTLENLLG
jgi:hypothetical protein